MARVANAASRQHRGVWLVFYRKHAGKAWLEYEEAVEEALCFGWIDSIIKKLDDDRYLRKFTPRKPDSNWSESNRKRVARLIREGLMTDAGAAPVAEAKASGRWSKPAPRPSAPEFPEELTRVLARSKKARTFFDKLPPREQERFVLWVGMAKRQETRDRRAREAGERLAEGRKLGAQVAGAVHGQEPPCRPFTGSK